MTQLAHTASQHLVHVTGHRSRWIRDGALVGLIAGYTGPAWIVFGLGLHPHLVACALSAAVFGAGLGAVVPSALERVRGRVPLPILGVALPVVAAGLGWCVAGLAAGLVGAPAWAGALFGAVATAGLATLFWLPYTVAAVMGLPRWPVVVAACVLSPLLGPLALVVATLL